MLVIFGLIIVVAAVVVGAAGVLGNDGGTHGVAHGFSVLGYHVNGSGTVFLYGIAVGAVGLFGLWRGVPPAAAARHGAVSGSPAARPPSPARKPPPSARTATTSSASATPPAPTPPARWPAPHPAAAVAPARTRAIR